MKDFPQRRVRTWVQPHWRERRSVSKTRSIRNQSGERIMQKGIASSLAAMGMAAAIVLPSAFVAHGRSDRADTSALSISESVDRADARIADLARP
jgi:hypothetical protein